MSNKEKIGYHKGALESLVKEKAELTRLLSIVDSLLEKHYNELDKTGVDADKFIEKLKNETDKSKSKQKDNSRRKRRSNNRDSGRSNRGRRRRSDSGSKY